MKNDEIINTNIGLEQNKQDVYVSSEQVDLGVQKEVQDEQVNATPRALGIQPKRGWNWGAFILPFWWCLFSYCYWQMILCLVPYVNIVWRFILAAKGNDWSWKTGKWKDADYFNKTQRIWNKTGIIFLIIVLLSVIAFVISDLLR